MFQIVNIFVILLTTVLTFSFAGVVTNSVKFDPKCSGAHLHELRLTDCTKFPCIIQRGKNYTIEGDFSLDKDVANPVLKCGTIYLGRQFSLPGHGGCETLTNGTCPLTAGVVYNTATTINIPYYVPPIHYTVSCRFEDEDGNGLVCGSGSGKVV